MGEENLVLLLRRLEGIEAALAELAACLRQRPAHEQEWLSIDEVAQLTGLSDDHVRRHVTSGLLPVSNQGTYDKPYYRIHRSDIDEWMRKRRESPSPAPRKKKTAAKFASRHHKKPRG